MHIGPVFRASVRHTSRFVLVVIQVGLTLAVVANCMTLLLSSREELGRASGFDDEHLIRVGIANWDPDLLTDADTALVVHREDLAAIRALEGVRAATSTSFTPWIGGGSSTEVILADTEMERLRVQSYGADTDFLETMGIEVVAGRWLRDEEIEANYDSGAYPVVITSAFARLLEPFAGGDPLGRALAQSLTDTDRYTIVGIVDPFFNPYGWPIGEYAVFRPGLRANQSSAAMLVRAEPGRTAELATQLEELIHQRRDGRTASVRTISEIKSIYHSPNRVLVLTLNGVMAALLVVTALGIVGLTSLSVAERRRQLGTRRALGATREDLVGLVLLETALVTGCGLALGIALAWGLDFALAQSVEGARMPWGAPLVAAAGLGLLGLLSALGPALRAARVPPAIATRTV